MLFNSFEFLLFFMVVFTAFFALPHRYRWVLLLVSSYIFYMAWKPVFIVLIMTTTGTCYLTAFLVSNERSAWKRRTMAALCIGANLGLLATFKYLDFFISSVVGISGILGADINLPLAHLLLPVGISFYTFQALSYVFDVYRDGTRVERNIFRYALYVSFFPQLVAGPIERSRDLLPQLRQETRFDFDRIRSGLQLVLWGTFKKMCIADLVSPVVKSVYEGNVENFNGTVLSLATLLFAFQIYCDFSGYSDVAIGVARMLGYNLTTNFRQPYFSTSLAEFWRRWHISLSNWFRDYVYIPLGGNRTNGGRWCVNIMIVFVLSGLWHGAAWTFVAWGALHGIWLLVEHLVFGGREKQKPGSCVIALIRWAVTTTVVLISWVFFVSKSFGDAWHVLTHFFRLGPIRYDTVARLGLPHVNLLALFMQLTILLGVDLVFRFRPARIMALWEKRWIRFLVYLFMIYNIVFFGVFKRLDFIYFQF